MVTAGIIGPSHLVPCSAELQTLAAGAGIKMSETSKSWCMFSNPTSQKEGFIHPKIKLRNVLNSKTSTWSADYVYLLCTMCTIALL